MKYKEMKRKGYFFTTDSIIALFILVVGISLIFAFKTSTPPTTQSEIYSFDLMDYLTKTKIKDVNHNHVFKLIEEDKITNKDLSLFEQIAEFYYRSNYKGCIECLPLAKNLTKTLTKELISKEFSYQIGLHIKYIVDDSGSLLELDEPVTIVIYSSLEDTPGVDSADARLIVPSRHLLHGVYEDELGVDFYGPYMGEVYVWQ